MKISKDIESVTFFFPYYDVSGVPVLFLRMAEYLADHLDFTVFVVDYPDGYMSRTRHSNSKVSIIPFNEGATLDISADTLLVMQSMLPNTICSELRIHQHTRVLFWTLHPLNLVQTILPFPFFRQLQLKSTLFCQMGQVLLFPRLRKRLRKFVLDMHANNSILFMDGSTFRTTTKVLGVTIADPLMLPVPSDNAIENLRLKNPRRPDRSINFCWVGRLADFKISILLYTLEKLKIYAVTKHFSITVHIIGDGQESDKLNSMLEPCDFFRVIMVGSLPMTELDHYLLNEIDVLAAMGTSALEGARLGVPTILLDFSYDTVSEGYRFKWLHESKDYTLGSVIDARHLVPDNSSLEEMMQFAILNFDTLSMQAFEYYNSNHSISFVADKFLAFAANANFRYGDFEDKILEKELVRKAYEYFRS